MSLVYCLARYGPNPFDLVNVFKKRQRVHWWGWRRSSCLELVANASAWRTRTASCLLPDRTLMVLCVPVGIIDVIIRQTTRSTVRRAVRALTRVFLCTLCLFAEHGWRRTPARLPPFAHTRSPLLSLMSLCASVPLQVAAATAVRAPGA